MRILPRDSPKRPYHGRLQFVPVVLGVDAVTTELTWTGSYHGPMSSLKDDRIHQARRDAIRNRLIGRTGYTTEVAEQWCDAWEAEAALRGMKKDADYWEAGKLWIDTRCAARKRPPN